MQVLMITPATPGSRAGNRATAERWQALLTGAGHTVAVDTEYHGQPCDVMIALHAWRSREAIQAFRERRPDRPLIVVLTGTDVYLHLNRCPEETLASLDAADSLIGLHDQLSRDIPARFADRLVTLYQSARVPAAQPAPPSDVFQVCVVGHLRDEKDSLRAALALRHIPVDRAVRVICAGKPLDDAWRDRALREARDNPRFQWLGELDQAGTERLLTGSHVMVISSVMEGGANVVSEACRAGVPVLASDIPGNRGLLGDDYPGYFPVGDEAALARLMLRAMDDRPFLDDVRRWVAERATRFTPEREQASLLAALALAVERCRQRRGGTG
ncbi:selenoneine biosynthesis selenosugar synthase SenB [Marinobacter sp. C2H3]|uniref:selenoneine biosynthesis selenosugar synthase SenB n=1 Tax=Marinobacter sp. C2H3 TaxID=3119003 RepID=UPI00300E90CB